MKKRKNVQLSQQIFKLLMSSIASQHLTHCATYVIVNWQGGSINHTFVYIKQVQVFSPVSDVTSDRAQ